MLKVDSLSVSYGTRSVLSDVNLKVGQNEIVSLIGANGAGKTTILKTIIGLLRPVSGTISFKNRDVHGLTVDRIVRSGISLCPEGRHVFANMSIIENLEMGAYVHARPDPAEIERVFQLFPVLKERINQPARVLSGGEQQMLAMGRALMAKPDLLLLDEPSMGLAPILVERIFEIILDIWKQGTSILLVEQNAAMALEICHRGYVLETGSIVLSDSGEKLKSNRMVSRAFLGREA
jgi:branched-chain amino acid transport system ATP-binding protein